MRKQFHKVQSGTTASVKAVYGGVVQVSCKEQKHPIFKCLHCVHPGFAGDLRRQARHFLPESLPHDLFKKGGRCKTPPPGLLKALAELGCQEHKKAIAFQQGLDYTAIDAVVPQSAETVARPSLGVFADASRYEQHLEDPPYFNQLENHLEGRSTSWREGGI